MNGKLRTIVLATLLALAAQPVALGAINARSAGTDGVLDPTANDGVCVGGLSGGVCTIDLGQAACDCSGSPPGSPTVCPAEGSPDACTWDDPSPVAGNGVYDRDKWAVVFEYSSINIQAGVTVKFINHPSRAPVVWLVNGSATIAATATVDLSGSDWSAASLLVEPGPGGFRGGRNRIPGTVASPGFGPGGGDRRQLDWGQGGSYGTLAQFASGPVYGNDRVIPLIGGSGGAGSDASSNPPRGGGAGGGALLLAVDDTITLEGSILSLGGDSEIITSSETWGGGGSGGAIRLIADSATGAGVLRAFGGNSISRGGQGRIRVEANSITFADVGGPAYTTGVPCTTPPDPCDAELWPEDLTTIPPTVRITDVAGETPPLDPRSSFDFPTQDIRFADPDPVTVTIVAENLTPQPQDWTVVVRATPRSGSYVTANAVYQSGDSTSSTWTATIAIPNGNSALQVRVFK